jgi:hypothetical protein
VKVLASVTFAYPNIIKLESPACQDRTILVNYNSYIRPHLRAEQLSEEIKQSYQKYQIPIALKKAVYRTRKA